MASSPTIRFATEADVPEILALIHELAAYENESSSVLATESSLLATLSFDPPPSSSSSTPTRGYSRTLLIFPPPSSPSSSSSSSSTSTSATPRAAAAGMALYYTSYSTWLASPGIFLEDLYVRPEFRKRGYGKLLIQRLAREVVEINGGGDGDGSSSNGKRGRLEWNVLKWNEPSLRFYENVGAARLDEWVGMRVDGDRLLELAGRGAGGGGEKGAELR